MSGKITIDGMDTSKLPLSLLRRSISLVAQDPFLWFSSIRDNLDPEKELGDEKIWMVLRKLGLHDTISALPDKLDTVLEDGGSFSKGQVCFAVNFLWEKSDVDIGSVNCFVSQESC